MDCIIFLAVIVRPRHCLQNGAWSCFVGFYWEEHLEIQSPVCTYLPVQWHLVQEQVKLVQVLFMNSVSF